MNPKNTPRHKSKAGGLRALARATCSYALLLLSAVALFTTVGCGSSEAISREKFARFLADDLAGEEDTFLQAVDYLYRYEEFKPDLVNPEILSRLNAWIADPEADPTWSLDPLVYRLPQQYFRFRSPDLYSDMTFQMDDVNALKEALWLHGVARRVQSLPVPQRLQPWMTAEAKRLGEEQADKLALAAKAFDWTVRNLQLDPPGYDLLSGDSDDGEPRPAPGEKYYTWETLLLSHGDAVDRAQVFAGIARQLDLDVVLLAIDPQGAGGETPADEPPRFWAAGALIGEEIYLFDPQLGLPIPNAEGHGIATLRQVIERPQLLRQLDLEGTPYWLTADDLQRVAALVDVGPSALSQRMKILQRQLAAEIQLALTAAPSAIRTRLREHPGIARVTLSPTPFGTLLYRLTLDRFIRENAKQQPEVAQRYAERHRFLYPFIDLKVITNRRTTDVMPIYQARVLHLRNQLENTEEKKGAKRHYLESRPAERQIVLLVDNPKAQRAFGLQSTIKSLKDPAEKREFITRWQNRFRRVQRFATYQLGLLAFEQGDYDTAADYFARRAIAEGQPSRWTAGVRYNLARSYEALGQRDKAIELLREDDSPQRQGNLLRAKWLEAAKPKSSS